MHCELSQENLTVAMITRNEEKAIVKVIQDIRHAVPLAEILVVDSSQDQTAELAQQAGARVIKQYPPEGYGPAMYKALTSATGKVIVTLDCDNTYPAEKIPELARYILEENYDVVDASRLKNKPAAMKWMNYIANIGFAALASLLFQRKITDLHSGMRAYRKTMIHALPWNEKGAAFPVELLLKPIRKNYRLKEIFINYNERIGNSTLQPLQSAWWTWKRIWHARFSGETQ